ncbi:MAG: hypothetical protein GY765_03540 [bacterium]|nr:hypothetical protein [bacterium]
MSETFCSIGDYMAFRAYVISDKNWNERHRLFTPGEIERFPFKEKIPILMKPAHSDKQVFPAPILECREPEKSKYKFHILLGIDFWKSLVKEKYG